MCGINASGAQGRDKTLSIYHALLKNAILLYTSLVEGVSFFHDCIYVFLEGTNGMSSERYHMKLLANPWHHIVLFVYYFSLS